jgi:zinc protease
MLRLRAAALLTTAAILSLPAVAAEERPDKPRLAKPPLVVKNETEPAIPYQMFKLDNGLTVLVHEDHKAPIVAVNIWYHVGSKNEKPGRTGFAHLFEHLMFNGSESYDDDYFKVMDRIGATDLNGTTNEDRTNYFQNVPTTALDTALWMESDRMGHLLGAVTQAKLDEQRGVVQNEKRQGENEPYAVAEEMITQACYPKGHPYSWTVIGSMDDLGAAKLEDVQEWFKTYYGPSNAVLVLAGDIDLATAKEKAGKYFGDISSGPPVGRFESWPAKRTGMQRATAQDRVPQPRLYKVWNTPGWATAEADYLDMVSGVLTAGKTSRLFKRLVYDDQIATNVVSYQDSREIGSLFTIFANAKPGVELSTIEKAIDEEMARLLKDGPTEAEVERVRTQTLAGFIRGSERIGGFGGKSDILAKGLVFRGTPEAYKTSLERVRSATPADLRKVAAEWLSDGVYALEITPFPEYKNASTGADRSKLPEAGVPPTASLPKVEKATLSNGLKVVLARRTAVPVVNLSLLLEGGYASDQFATPGTASLAMNMLDEGTSSRNALQISEELQRLGATLNTGANLDQATVAMSALKANLGPSLDLLADVVLHPTFPQQDFERLKQQRLSQIRNEKSSPVAMGLRVFPPLLFGSGHAYGLPFTGSGYEDTVTKMERAALVKYHETWFKPDHATLVVVGDTTLDEIRPMLEERLKGWAKGSVPTKNLAQVTIPAKPVVYLVDRPGSLQSVILAGHVAPPTNNPDEIAIQTLNTILGGSFTSRLNMNLREDKHWSYGAGSFFVDARGQRPFLAYAPVQTDKTKESVAEVAKELKEILGSRPATEEELAKAKDNQTLTLAGQWETANAVAGSLTDMVRYGLAEDYYATYPGKVRALDVGGVSSAAKVLHPDRLVWVIVGDRAKIETGIRELNLGEIKYLDADGKPVS